jgi:ABC-2 type transport system ATP-binding protein
MIQTNKLTKYYKKHARGIIDVSLDIKKGEIFGFIGPNGSGKSTTVRTLLNLIFPTSGSGIIDGKDIVSESVLIRNQVGYIPSEVYFYEDMTVRNFLEYAASFHSADCTKRRNELIKRLELDLNRTIGELSFGNKKKVAIVQALQFSPNILILDEPTSGLDPFMQNTFFQLILEEKKRGVTIFFSSHILSEVQRICDRVGIIKDGKLIKVETIENIMKTNAKRVKIKTTHVISPNKQTKELKQEGPYTTFLFTGNVQELLSFIAPLAITDLTITEPSLEEIFLHYYSREDTL